MAEELENVELQRNRQGRKSRYPWQDWMNGSAWRVERGADYEISTLNFVAGLYAKAATKGVKVTTATEGDTVTFQFYTDKN